MKGKKIILAVIVGMFLGAFVLGAITKNDEVFKVMVLCTCITCVPAGFFLIDSYAQKIGGNK